MKNVTLLDYFAAKAMQAYVTIEPNTTAPEDIAEWAYSVALCMINQRREYEDENNE